MSNCKEADKLSDLLLNSKLKIINKDYGIGRIIQLIIQDLKSLIKEKDKIINFIPILKVKKQRPLDFLNGIINILENLLKKNDYILLKEDIETHLINLIMHYCSINENDAKDLLKNLIKILFNLFIKDNYGFYIDEKNVITSNSKITRINNDKNTTLNQSKSGSIIANLLLKINYSSPEYFDINFFASNILLSVAIDRGIAIKEFIKYESKNLQIKNYQGLSCFLFSWLDTLKYFINIYRIVYGRIAQFGIIISNNVNNISHKTSSLDKFEFTKNTINKKMNIKGLCEINNNILNIDLIYEYDNITVSRILGGGNISSSHPSISSSNEKKSCKEFYFSNFVLSFTIKSNNILKNNTNNTKEDLYNKIYGIINTTIFLKQIYLFDNIANTNKFKIKLNNIIIFKNNEYNICLIFPKKKYESFINYNNYFITIKKLEYEIYRPINTVREKNQILNDIKNILLNDEFTVELVPIIDKNKTITLTIQRTISKQEYIIRKSCLFNFRDNDYLIIKYNEGLINSIKKTFKSSLQILK